jgi:hypothetical protein
MIRRRHVALGTLWSTVEPRAASIVVLGIFLRFGFAFGLAACSGEPVGRICDLGTSTPQVSEVVVASPSLDCVSRTCLRVPLSRELPPGSQFPQGNSGLCTAECTADSDCERVPESPCITGFTCGVAVTVGPFCCRRFCICKDYIVIPESGELPEPKACDVGDMSNQCCNLPDRPACNT